MFDFLRNKLSPPSAGAKRPAKIVGLVPARNESASIEFCLRALARYTDAIVYLDDCSEDDSVKIVESLAAQCRVESIIRKPTWHRDEPGDRNRMLQAGREIGGSHFVVIDADEAFTANCEEGDFLRQKILALRPGDQLAALWIQLWRSSRQYRCDDSVWTNNRKRVAFGDEPGASYESDFIHTSKVPKNLSGRRSALEGDERGLLHFQFVNWRNMLVKQAWYRCLERIRNPDKPAAKINERYRASKDETGLRLKAAPAAWLAGYPFFDETMFAAPDRWREAQIREWFERYGRDCFADLDIWDVNWDVPEGAQVKRV